MIEVRDQTCIVDVNDHRHKMQLQNSVSQARVILLLFEMKGLQSKVWRTEQLSWNEHPDKGSAIRRWCKTWNLFQVDWVWTHRSRLIPARALALVSMKNRGSQNIKDILESTLTSYRPNPIKVASLLCQPREHVIGKRIMEHYRRKRGGEGGGIMYHYRIG